MNPAAFESGMMLMGKHPSQLNAQQFERRTDLDLAQYLEQQQERTKQEAAAGKSAEYFFKANPQALKELNLDEPSLANMSAADKYTAMVSYGKAQMEREAQQKRAMDEQTRSVFQEAMARRMNSPLGGDRPDADPLAAAREAIIETAQRTGNPGLLNGLRNLDAAGAGQQNFFNRKDVGKIIPVEGADGYGLAVTGPNQSQAFFTGKPQGSAVNVPGVGDVGVITTKPGQTQIVPGQQTQGQIREQLAKAEADIAKLKTKLKADPELSQYLGGALAEQESLAASYREALGGKTPSPRDGEAVLRGNTKNQTPTPMPAVGEVRGGYRFKGGNPRDKANWEAVQ